MGLGQLFYERSPASLNLWSVRQPQDAGRDRMAQRRARL